jgi:DNA-binding NtrC family response regulator
MPRGGGGRAIKEEPAKDVLVLLEPDESVCDALRTLLQGRGWAVETAKDALGLETLLKKPRVKAVISEASLPNCHAADVLRACARQQVPVIFTGYDLSAQTAVDLIRQGGHDYLEKPFQQERLLDLLKRLPNRHNS